MKNYNLKYYTLHPWMKNLKSICSRCGYRNHDYFKKGIKNFITKEEIKELWFRDKAYLLKRPSIDRINPNGNYTLENCRFIELKENQSQGGKTLSKLRKMKIYPYPYQKISPKQTL